MITDYLKLSEAWLLAFKKYFVHVVLNVFVIILI